MTVSRLTSALDSEDTCVVPCGPSTRWSAAAASRSLLRTVEWISPSRVPFAACSSPCSGDSSAAATRGSPSVRAISSLATSSDCTTTRTCSSSGSTS